jgi:hypothetical protein
MRAETAASRWVETYKALISWYINVRGAHPQESDILGMRKCAVRIVRRTRREAGLRW